MQSTRSHQTLSSTSRDHAGDKSSPNDSNVHGKKGKVNFPCRLCERNHIIHIFPYMDEASKLFGNLTISQPQLLTGYKKLSPNPPLLVEVIDQNLSPFNPTLCKLESREFFLDQPLVNKMVEYIPPSVNRTFPLESESYTTQVLLVSSYSSEIGGILSFQ